MQNVNLKHLRYFWVVARRGSITSASEVLHLTPQTISGQLRMLEDSIGAKVHEISGRNLVLTDTGRVVSSYAEEIFKKNSK
jgi:LysR family transcriptional activator of nhaA